MAFAFNLKTLFALIPANAGIQARRNWADTYSQSQILASTSFFSPSPPLRGRGKSVGEVTHGRLSIIGAMMICLFFLLVPQLYAASSPDLEDRTREVATELRCVVCQNLSAADSASELAQQMRAIVREQFGREDPEQIKNLV